MIDFLVNVVRGVPPQLATVLLAVAKLFGYKIAERPIKWVNDADSKVSASAYLQVFKEVVEVRFNIWRGVYGEKSNNK